MYLGGVDSKNWFGVGGPGIPATGRLERTDVGLVSGYLMQPRLTISQMQGKGWLLHQGVYSFDLFRGSPMSAGNNDVVEAEIMEER